MRGAAELVRSSWPLTCCSPRLVAWGNKMSPRPGGLENRPQVGDLKIVPPGRWPGKYLPGVWDLEKCLPGVWDLEKRLPGVWDPENRPPGR